jgi:hypothetical protein
MSERKKITYERASHHVQINIVLNGWLKNHIVDLLIIECMRSLANFYFVKTQVM